MSSKVENFKKKETLSKQQEKFLQTTKLERWVDDTWSLDTIESSTKWDSSIRYILFVSDNYSKFRWTVAQKESKAQTTTASLLP